jgi:putative addiction module component (TIGR02574 family)
MHPMNAVSDEGFPPMATGEMEMSSEDLKAAVLALPKEERADLAELLIDSLVDQEEIDQAWIIECRRRLGEIERGEVELIDNEEVFAKLRARYG